MRKTLLVLLIASPLFAQKSPYVTNRANDIKALSPETLDAYRNGTGMGMAIPAELNGYPGPRHIIDLAEQLELTADQRKQIQSIYDDMHAGAVRLGREIVDLEQKLDRGFAQKTMTPADLQSLTAGIAARQGELRFTHLKAHLAAKSVLSASQVEKYIALRGYGGEHSEHHHDHHHGE
ncbi:MAG TPA: Spy/CpxP family protein refolding chaperone [Thermoanaerobaculia bacterium]